MSLQIHCPETLEELCLRLSDGAQILGGGTVLVPRWVQAGPPVSVVSLDRIVLARQLTPNYVGSAVTLSQVTDSDVPTVLREAARSIGTPCLRSQATVGGNVGTDRVGCLLTALVSLEARALVLYGSKGREANMTLEEARGTGAVILGLEWRSPAISRYRKLRRGRAGLPEFALGMSVKERGDTRRLTAAVWRDGQVDAASTSLGGGNDVVGEAVEAVVAGLAFRPLLRQWERAVLAEEIRALSDENTPALTLSGNRR